MTATGVSTASIDYLQRTGMSPVPEPGALFAATHDGRRLLRVRGIGREEKRLAPPVSPEHWQVPTVDLVTGLYGHHIPLAFLVDGGNEGVRLRIGTWTARPEGERSLDRRLDVLTTLLRGLFRTVDLASDDVTPNRWPLSGVALGIPTAKPPVPGDPTLAWDRLIRAMAGTDWGAFILAYPLSEETAAHVRHGILNEMRAAQEAAKQEAAPSPLTDFYVDLLKRSLTSLSQGAATGSWRVACYLLGDDRSYPRLASIWRSSFSGEDSLPEPVRVFDAPETAAWAEQWAMPDQDGAVGPGYYRRPFEHQTLLTSADLAAYVHLPLQELPGFAVDTVPCFDSVATARTNEPAVVVGQVIHGNQPTTAGYQVPTRSLSRHVLVCGVTGSGKSTTIFQLLEQLSDQDVPFLVVEPAKAEYRSLLEHPKIGPKLQVFTLGDEMTSAFRINPFEVPGGVSVAEHIDVLRAVIAGSFGMWTPLPQVLERCLYEIYAERGWDLLSNTNRRASESGHRRAAPTLTHLAAKVEPVTAALGYEERITGDLKAALLTRIQSLRSGGKGRMLDVAASVPIDALLARPTVLELDRMGDDDDKAFLMGLLLVRLVQHRRRTGATKELRHVLVIEEAHRLLSARGPKLSQEEADPKGKVVEMFSHLLSEIRAYGEGVIIADQVPVRLAPDVLKNTGLKIVHRTVATDDREALAGAMNMSEVQAQALASLPVGRAAVFGGGDDAPVLVQVPETKERLLADRADDDRVRGHMTAWRTDQSLDHLYRPTSTCAETCVDATRECQHAQQLIDDEAVQRTVARLLASALEDVGALQRLWGDLIHVVRARAVAGIDEAKLLRSLAGHGAEWFAERRGAQAGWSYPDTDRAAAAARRLLLAGGGASEPVADDDDEAAHATLLTLHTRTFDPYPECDRVCGPSACRYRGTVHDLVGSGRWDERWRAADDADAQAGNREQTWALCMDAGYELVEWPDPSTANEPAAPIVAAARRACLCVAQQLLERDQRKIPRTKRWVLHQILEHSGK